MVKKILSGQIKISHDNIVELSRLPLSEIRKISTQLAGPRSNQVGYSGSRRELTNRLPPKREAERLISAEIKNMPLPDPDAEVSSLSLTIPSWVSSIDRARTHSDFHTVSNEAKQKLVQQLFSLKECINTMLLAIKEDV